VPDRIVHGHMFVSFSRNRRIADLIDIGFDRPGQYSRNPAGMQALNAKWPLWVPVK